MTRPVPAVVAVLLATALLAAALLPGCGGDYPAADPDAGITRLSLTIVFDEEVVVTQAQIAAAGVSFSLEGDDVPLVSPLSMTVLVDDALAGTPQRVTVRGSTDGQPVAFGEAEVTPRLGAAVPVEVTLEPLTE